MKHFNDLGEALRHELPEANRNLTTLLRTQRVGSMGQDIEAVGSPREINREF